ncbi:hypothetical protein BDW74DRAFT_178065 [Aspergillus multicolor]|uniref:uncharacterized protein n=1 Tax=Aspergillus multicolor TaxID=41759 RepID=UPI003CCE0521
MNDDPLRQPCIIYWNALQEAFGQPDSGILLLLVERYTRATDIEPLQVDSSQLPQRSQCGPVPVSASNPSIKQLDPGTCVSCEIELPPAYRDKFNLFDKYEIFWTGGQIPFWEWGTLAEFEGSRALSPNTPRPALVLPGGPRLGLYFASMEDTDDEDEDDFPCRPPTPKPTPVSDRVPGAPVFSVSVKGPATLSLKEDRDAEGRLYYPLTVTVTYDAPPADALDLEDNSPAKLKPVIFHMFVFTMHDRRDEGFRLYRRDDENHRWLGHEIHPCFGNPNWRWADSKQYNIGRNEGDKFRVLRPGESWQFTRAVSEFPEDVKAGDMLMYGFKGAVLDWWDYGDFEDHLDTVVMAKERWKVEVPQDNWGRPKIVVPGGKWEVFIVVEEN